MKTEEVAANTETEATAPTKRTSSPLGLLVLVILAGALGYFIYGGINSRVAADSALTHETLKAAVPNVAVVHPVLTTPNEEVLLPGNVQAYTDTPIYARTNGYLRHWYADIGTHVSTGQLLADIETPEVDQQIQQARADLATAQANFGLAQSTAARYEALLKSDSVSRQETDEKAADLNAKKAIVDSAGFNVKRLEQTQGFQKIYAPFDGVITARNIDIGALIDSGSSSSTNSSSSKELFHEAATGTLRVYVNVPQIYSRDTRVGSHADLTLKEFPNRRFYATLVRTAGAIDASSRTLLTEYDVNNASGELLAGSYVSVHLKLPKKVQAVTIPVNTLMFRAEGLRVAVVRNGRAQIVPFVIGRDFGSTVEVVGGIASSDSVIVNPSDSLTSGTEVNIAK